MYLVLFNIFIRSARVLFTPKIGIFFTDLLITTVLITGSCFVLLSTELYNYLLSFRFIAYFFGLLSYFRKNEALTLILFSFILGDFSWGCLNLMVLLTNSIFPLPTSGLKFLIFRLLLLWFSLKLVSSSFRSLLLATPNSMYRVNRLSLMY